MTATGAMAGQLFLILAVPFMLSGQYSPPLGFILLLFVASTLSALLQLALSRTREFDADREAARLTGDPADLASALAKFEHDQHGLLGRLFDPVRRLPMLALMRTHPTTAGRIERLRALGGDRSIQPPAARITQMPQVVRLFHGQPQS